MTYSFSELAFFVLLAGSTSLIFGYVAGHQAGFDAARRAGRRGNRAVTPPAGERHHGGTARSATTGRPPTIGSRP